jgi:type II secretory pathway component PulJ
MPVKASRRQNIKGFTLIELLVYMGLSAIFIVILTEIMVATVNVKLDSQSFSSVESDYRYLTLKLAQDISSASAISQPAAIGTPSSTLALTINGATNTYAVSNSRLAVTNSYGVNYLTSGETKVSNFQITRYGPAGRYVKVVLGLESATLVNGSPKTKTLSFTTGLR